jgi:hypothetical protein
MTSSGFDRWFRAAAGRAAPAPELQRDRPVGHFGPAPRDGSIGIGKGGAAGLAPRARLDSLDVSNRIRRAALIARSTVIPQGVDPFE